jgi:hypothetical protein
MQKLQSLGGEFVDVGSCVILPTIATKICITHVVGHDVNDIWTLRQCIQGMENNKTEEDDSSL